MRYRQEYSGAWVRFHQGHRIRCCDCCLVHDIYVRIRKGHIEVKPYLNNRATAASRRGKRWEQKRKKLVGR